MKKILIIIALALYATPLLAQDEDAKFYFNYSVDELNYEEASEGFVPKHYLGEEMAVKMNMLRLTYTYKPEPTSMVPNPTMVVEKPSIYTSIKKLNTYYKKQIKKGNISEEDAQEKLSDLFELGVVIRYQDTFELEEALKSVKIEKEIEEVFSRIEFK